jgi:Carboxypeptidase regulatory-like domain/TonB dependent receptor
MTCQPGGWLILAVLVTLASAPASSLAQVTTAEIGGSTVDESGAVLPGVTVTARNVQTGLERTTTSNERGRYTLFALPPGSYVIRAELPGFATETRDGLALSINQQVVLNVTLKLASLAEAITVTSEAPLVQTTRAELGKTIDTTTIDSLPLNGRDFAQLAALVPGVKSTGGAAMNIGGQISRNNSFSVDGVDNNSELLGGRQARYSQDVIREFQVLTNQFSAEFGRASGGVVNILTRSGTNDLTGRVFYYLRDEAFDATPAFASDKALFQRQQFGGTVGGPVARDRTHYFASVERLTEDRVASVVTPVLRGDFPQPTREILGFGKLTHQISDKHSLQASYNFTKQDQEGQGVGGRQLPSHAFDSRTQNHIFVLGQTSVLSDTALNELRFSVQRRRTQSDAREPGPEIQRPSTIEGRANNMPQGWVEDRYQITENFTKIFDWRGEHSVKFGSDINLIRGDSVVETLFHGQWVFATDRPFDANDLSTYPIQYSIRTGDPYVATPNNILAFYVRDNWKPHPRFTFNLGLRYDLEVATIGSVYPTDKNNLGPRLGFAWTPFKDAKTVVHGGYGLFYDQLFGNLQMNMLRAGAPPPIGIGITRTIVLNNPGYPDPFSRSGAVALEDGLISDGGEISPYSGQFNFGFSRQLTSTMALSADYVHVRGYHMARPHDHNAPDRITGIRPLPAYGKIYTYETSGDTWYDALQASVEKRLSHRFQFLASYTLSKTLDNIWPTFINQVGSAPQSQTDLDAEKSLSPVDERHRLVASGVAHLPLGFQLGAILTTFSGRPYNITTGRDNNLDGHVSDRPNFVPDAEGNARYVDPGIGFNVVGNLGRNVGLGTGYLALDLRLSKIVKVSGTSIEVLAEAFNVTNRVNYNAFTGNIRSSLFGKPVSAFDSRQIQIGAKVDF